MNKSKATHKIVNRLGDSYEVYFKDSWGWWATTDGSMYFKADHIHSLTPLPASSEPETFDWKEAMRLFADGVELQMYIYEEWVNISLTWDVLTFDRNVKYRVKPTATPAPKVTEIWVNVYKSGWIGAGYTSFNNALLGKKEETAACLKITVTEGEKLPRVEVLPV